jgi:hypothetical protein
MPNGTHPWFQAGPVPSEDRIPVDDAAAMLRHELRDCGTWLHVEPVPLEPFVVSRRSYDELFDAARGLLNLLRRALIELAPTRKGRLAALGIEPTRRYFPFFTEDDDFELRYCDVMARPDIVIGQDGPQFMEFNVSGTFGGPTETHLFSEAWARIYGAAGRASFSGDDPFAARASLFEEVCAELGLPRSVALIGNRTDRGKARTTRYFDVEADFLRGRGFDVAVLEPRDLPSGIGRKGRLRFPLALRDFTPVDWVARGEPLDCVHAVIAAGCVLFPPESSYLIANKKLLALLSQGQPWMSDKDRRLVGTYVPWTRITRPCKTEWEGELVDLRRLVTEHRERFVLKQGVGMMGCEVLIGRMSAAEQWDAAVENAMEHEHSVVQAYVEPGRYDLEMVEGPGTDPYRRSVAPVLSPCVFGGRPGGMYARYYPSGRAGVVGVARGGAMENVVFAAR